MNRGEIKEVNEVLNDAESKLNSQLAKMENEMGVVREESRALGILHKIEYDEAHNGLLKYAVLYQIKQNKIYRKEGMAWDKFCEAIGENVRNVDRILKDIRPIYDNFSDKLSDLIGLSFNKIRYLGRSISDNLSEIKDGDLVVDGTAIPLLPENKDDIEALIDNIKETHQKEKKTLSEEVKNLKKNVDKIVDEETKSLKVECSALIKENKRLKAFDPEEKDHEWSVEQMQVLESAAYEFAAACRRLKMDERIKDDLHVQAKVEAKMNEVGKLFREVQKEWDETFNANWE